MDFFSEHVLTSRKSNRDDFFEEHSPIYEDFAKCIQELTAELAQLSPDVKYNYNWHAPSSDDEFISMNQRLIKELESDNESEFYKGEFTNENDYSPFNATSKSIMVDSYNDYVAPIVHNESKIQLKHPTIRSIIKDTKYFNDRFANECQQPIEWITIRKPLFSRLEYVYKQVNNILIRSIPSNYNLQTQTCTSIQSRKSISMHTIAHYMDDIINENSLTYEDLKKLFHPKLHNLDNYFINTIVDKIKHNNYN